MNPRPRHPRLVGFAALLLLLTLLVGLPAVLLSLGWGPLPSGLDGWWAALTTPDDGHLTCSSSRSPRGWSGDPRRDDPHRGGRGPARSPAAQTARSALVAGARAPARGRSSAAVHQRPLRGAGRVRGSDRADARIDSTRGIRARGRRGDNLSGSTNGRRGVRRHPHGEARRDTVVDRRAPPRRRKPVPRDRQAQPERPAGQAAVPSARVGAEAAVDRCGGRRIRRGARVHRGEG